MSKGALNWGDTAAQDVSVRIYGFVDAEADLDDIPVKSRADGMLAVVVGDASVWIFDGDSSATEVTGSVRQPASGDGRWIRTGATIGETNARIAASVADTTALQAISAANRSDGQLVVKRDTDTLWTFDSASSASASAWVVVPSAGTGRWLRNHVSLADLASVANAFGASLIGLEDAAGNYTATNVEAAFTEVYGRTKAGTGTLSSGTATINTATITATSRIQVTMKDPGAGAITGFASFEVPVASRVVGAPGSFVVNAIDDAKALIATAACTFDWVVIG